MDQLDQTYAAFFALLRTSLWGAERFPFSPAPGTDFQAICQELRYHAIENLPVDLLAKADPGNQLRYVQRAAKGCTNWYRLMQTQQEIFRILDDALIRAATLKGAAADICYPQPTGRNMGDIDIIVKPQDLDRALNMLLENGCTLHDDRNPRHIELRRNGIQIELHRHFTTLSDAKRAGILDGYLFAALDRAEKQSIEGYEFYMLPKLENGLVLIEHINSHMETGLGLRQIIDWMLYVDKELDDKSWFDGFEAAVQGVGLDKLAVTVTRMCQIYLGLRSDITWCRTADDKLCAQLLEHTMKQGNFGRKLDSQSRRTVNVLGILDSDMNFFRLLQRHGCYNWKALKKYPWLRPFAWAYQLCRYIKKSLRGANPIGTFLGAFRKKKQNADLLTALGIQRKDHTLKYEDQ